MRAVALMLSASLLATQLGGCFPHEPQKRFYAKLTEGAFIAGGVTMLALTNTGADCDVNKFPGEVNDQACHNSEGTIGTIGLGLMLIGIVGFIATISTTEEDKTPPVVITAAPTTPPPATAGSGSASGTQGGGNGSGSADPTQPTTFVAPPIPSPPPPSATPLP